MAPAEVTRTLERAGTVQNREVYAGHGVGPVRFGVSTANQRVPENEVLLDAFADGDHGETGCKTPESSAYTRRTLARPKART